MSGLKLNKVNFIEIKCSDFQVEKKWKKKDGIGELSGDFINYITYT